MLAYRLCRVLPGLTSDSSESDAPCSATSEPSVPFFRRRRGLLRPAGLLPGLRAFTVGDCCCRATSAAADRRKLGSRWRWEALLLVGGVLFGRVAAGLAVILGLATRQALGVAAAEGTGAAGTTLPAGWVMLVARSWSTRPAGVCLWGREGG